MSNPTSVPVLAHRVDELRQSGQSEANVERQLARFLREHELTDEEIHEKITLVSDFITRREAEVVEAAAREAQMTATSKAILGTHSGPLERARGKTPDPPRPDAIPNPDMAIQEEVRSLRALLQTMTERMEAMVASQATPQTSSVLTPLMTEVPPA